MTGVPQQDEVGVGVYTLTVVDSKGLETQQSFNYEVQNVNDAPILEPIQNISLHEDQHLTEFDHIVNSFELKFDASDEDSSNLTFEYFALDGLTLTEANQQYGGFGFLSHNSNGQMNFTPTNHYVGEHGILVKVSDDDGASDTQIFNVTVLNTNDAPVFDMATDQVAYEDVEFTFQLTATDEDQGLTWENVTVNPDETLSFTH